MSVRHGQAAALDRDHSVEIMVFAHSVELAAV
jgi:hypothetical protein